MTARLCDVREIQAIDDDEIIDRPLTLVIGFARASKRWLINEREANIRARTRFGRASAARKCTNQYAYTSACRSFGIVTWARNLRLGEETKFAKNRTRRIGGRPKLTILSDASLQIFLRSRVFPAAPARYRYASSLVRSPNLTRFPRVRQRSQVRFFYKARLNLVESCGGIIIIQSIADVCV